VLLGGMSGARWQPSTVSSHSQLMNTTLYDQMCVGWMSIYTS
jgi:hypothetical protein